MSPFIVTTTRSCNCEPSTCESDGLLYHETRCSVFKVPRSERGYRRAVATLEEAKAESAALLEGHEYTNDQFFATALIPESGGTVGPLPDGTTIQVEPTTYADLDVLGWLNMADGQILAAFNARQGGLDPSRCGSSEHAEPESAERSPDPRRHP